MPDPIPLSIVITCHRQADQVCDILSRIAADDLSGVDIAVVDDCSPMVEFNSLRKFVDEWRDDRAVLSLPTEITCRRLDEWGGAGGARNRGVQLTRGAYLWLVDGDDEIVAGAIPRMVRYLAKCKSDIVLLPYSHGPKPEQLTVHTIEPDETCPKPYQWRIAPWGKLVSRDIFVGFTERVMFEDTDWHFLVCDLAHTRAFMPGGPCYIYRTDVADSQLDLMRRMTPAAVTDRLAMVSRIRANIDSGLMLNREICNYCHRFNLMMLESIMPQLKEDAHAK